MNRTTKDKDGDDVLKKEDIPPVAEVADNFAAKLLKLGVSPEDVYMDRANFLMGVMAARHIIGRIGQVGEISDKERNDLLYDWFDGAEQELDLMYTTEVAMDANAGPHGAN